MKKSIRILSIIILVGFTYFTVRYHEVWNLKNKQKIGQLGSLKYLLDRDGYRISKGYHEIYLREDGRYDAKLGSGRYILDKYGRRE